MRRRMLVTGGAGFIGSNFVHHTLAHRGDYEVAVLDTLTDPHYTNNLNPVADEIEFHRGDVSDASTVDALIEDLSIDVVVHFAAESHNDRAQLYPDRFARTNILGTLTLLENARRTGVRLHCVSTDEVFGDLPLDSTDRFGPNTPFQPTNYYSSSKASADHFVRAAFKQFEVPVTTSNCTNNFGPYQHVEKVIPRQITDVLCGTRPKLHGTGSNVRDWIHVEDHCTAVHAILDRGRLGATYLVGAENEWSNSDLLQEILAATDMPEDWFEHVPDRPYNDLRYAVDASRVREECRWAPVRTDFRTELKEIVEWYREHRSWWASMKDATEQAYRWLGR